LPRATFSHFYVSDNGVASLALMESIHTSATLASGQGPREIATSRAVAISEQAAERTVERAASAVRKIGVAPLNHPWYGALGIRLTPFDAERLNNALGEGMRLANDLIVVGSKADVRSFVS
jgi:hypothetical protein